MCGITGGWWREPSPGCRQKVQEALEAMRLRGPNDRGFDMHDSAHGAVALGQTRLSIIDLSSGGHQPMNSGDNAYSLVFNGEIYNYKELREELRAAGHRFQSDSDTEVLLCAWMHWGRACIPRLVGMFAFAIHDRSKGTLTCVRDAFGIKPFYYLPEGARFLFASSIPAIQAIKGDKGSLNWQQAYDYLVHGTYDTGASTFLSGVLHLLPGHLVELDIRSGKLGEPEKWWSPSIIERTDLSFMEAAELVRARFLESIRLQLRSDVPLGAALSGGIDSSAVVCAMRKVEPELPINTFSFIARGYSISEEPWVDLINDHVGATPHKVTASAGELAADLDDMIRAQGEPFGSTSIYAQYRVFRLAKESGVTVTLDGQGADEMLGGYIGYPGHRIRSLLEKGKVAEAWHFLEAWAKWPGRSRALGGKLAVAELTRGRLNDMLRRLSGRNPRPSWIHEGPLVDRGVLCRYPHPGHSHGEPGRRVVAELLRELTLRGLPTLLRHGDRNSMHFSIESRVPFLTPDFVQLMLSLPESYLVSPTGETKSVFRQAMRGIVPDQVLDRRDKIGFETPEKAWLMSMHETIHQWLAVDMHLPFFNQKAVMNEVDLIFAGKKPFSWQVWRWINFCRWHDCFLA